MAQEKDPNTYVAHQFYVNAKFNGDSQAVTLTVEDGVSKKHWEKTYTKMDFPDIKATYDEMKVAIDSNKLACVFPDDGKPLDLVIMTGQPLNLELPETQKQK